MTYETDTAKTKAEDSPQGTQDNKGKKQKVPMVKEVGGTKGPEPTRYGDWEHKGIISDF